MKKIFHIIFKIVKKIINSICNFLHINKNQHVWKNDKIQNRFFNQLKWREKIYGIPLPDLQKIKAARAISHEVYPTKKYKGRKGHLIRERFRKKILKSVGFNYQIKD
jgi:hypothetical protein